MLVVAVRAGSKWRRRRNPRDVRVVAVVAGMRATEETNGLKISVYPETT